MTAAVTVRPVPGQRVVRVGASSAAEPAAFRRQMYPSMVIGVEAGTGRLVMWDPFDESEVWSERPDRLMVVQHQPAASTVDGAA